MIRRHHYKCKCNHWDYEHDECQVLANAQGERPCGEAFHLHCMKCECWNFDLDEQFEADRYADAQERKVDEYRDRQMDDDDV